MLTDCREIIHEISIAPNLDEALVVLVRRVKDSLPVDAFAIHLTGAEAGQYDLKASDPATPDPTRHVRSGAQAGLLGLIGEHRELVVLNNAAAHSRYAPAAETGGRHFDTFLGIPLIHYRQVLGVLVAWRQVRDQFEKDEVWFFVTIAAQLAKTIYEASNVDVVVQLLRNGAEEHAFIQGVQAATGLAIGTATLIDPLANLKSVPDRQSVDIDAQEAATCKYCFPWSPRSVSWMRRWNRWHALTAS